MQRDACNYRIVSYCILSHRIVPHEHANIYARQPTARAVGLQGEAGDTLDAAAGAADAEVAVGRAGRCDGGFKE